MTPKKTIKYGYCQLQIINEILATRLDIDIMSEDRQMSVIYYGDDEEDDMRRGNSKRGLVREQQASKTEDSTAKMMRCHLISGVIIVMSIVLCSAVVVVLIKDPLGFQSAAALPLERERDLARRSFNEACDIGWIDGNLVQLGCLLFGNEKMNWTQASTFCKRENSRLVEIHDKNQEIFIKSYIKIIDAISNATISWWAGGTDDANRDWLWAESRLPIQDFVWASGEPTKNRKHNDAMCLNSESCRAEIVACDCYNTSLNKPICQVN